MSIVFLTGNHARHFYMAEQVAQTGFLSALIIEKRENPTPEPPPGLRPETERLFRQHFQLRQNAEERHFGPPKLNALSYTFDAIEVNREVINGEEVRAVIRTKQPTILLSYGVDKLSPETLSLATKYRWNIHGGLSPWYRGVITHFWPSYMLEPQFTGMTLHETTEAIDGGGLIHQSAAPLIQGDSLHDLACRAVKSFAEELPAILTRAVEGKPISVKPQGTTGRLWRSLDWRPEHLHVVYELYGNRIVDKLLAGELTGRSPVLFRDNLVASR